jgi:hypothetical protein
VSERRTVEEIQAAIKALDPRMQYVGWGSPDEKGEWRVRVDGDFTAAELRQLANALDPQPVIGYVYDEPAEYPVFMAPKVFQAWKKLEDRRVARFFPVVKGTP